MLSQSHHTQPKVIKYRVLHFSDQRKHKPWKTFCDVSAGYELTKEAEYKIKREIEEQNGLFLSTIEVRLT